MTVLETDISWVNSATGPGSGGSVGSALHSNESTLTSAGVAGDTVLFDTALGGGDGAHDGKYLALLNGNSALYAGRISRFLSGGRMVMDTELPSTVSIGDDYRLFPTTSVVFPDTTPLQCALGSLSHAAIFAQNNKVGESFKLNVVWLKHINPGPVTRFDLFVDDVSGTSGFIPVIANRVAGPTAGQLNAIDPANDWSQPLSYNQGFVMQPRNDAATLQHSGGTRPMYVRRTVDPQVRASHAAVMLVIEGEGTVTPGVQVRVPVVLTMDFDGFTPDITLGFDRRLFIGGGARIEAQIDVEETGEPATNLDVGFSLQAPSPGSLELPDAGTITDDDGKTYAGYVASTNQGDAGDDVTIEVLV